jgi:hypothetical protein
MAHAGTQISDEMQQCIDNCLDCHRICLETVTHCLGMGGKHAEASHIQTMLDCAEACAVSANTMLRGSPLHKKMCGLCAEFCIRCAESCEKTGSDEQMKRCAEVCRRCADSCRRMAA